MPYMTCIADLVFIGDNISGVENLKLKSGKSLLKDDASWKGSQISWRKVNLGDLRLINDVR